MNISYIIIENYNPMRKGMQRLYFDFFEEWSTFDIRIGVYKSKIVDIMTKMYDILCYYVVQE